MTVRFDDPLMVNNKPDRVNYENGILLDDVDFKDEQTYHRGRLSRLLSYLHGTGTVAGLNVLSKEDENEVITITAGLAIDRLGRMIEVPRAYCFNVEKWFSEQVKDGLGKTRLEQSLVEADDDIPASVVVDMFIKFAVCERGKTPALGYGNLDMTDAFAVARLRDAFKLELRIRNDGVDDIPVPNKGISDLQGATVSDRKSALENYKLNEGWRENTLWTSIDGQLVKDVEHLQDQDGSEVFLARLNIPVTQEEELTYNKTLSIIFNNELRRFVHSTQEINWILEAGE